MIDNKKEVLKAVDDTGVCEEGGPVAVSVQIVNVHLSLNLCGLIMAVECLIINSSTVVCACRWRPSAFL